MKKTLSLELLHDLKRESSVKPKPSLNPEAFVYTTRLDEMNVFLDKNFTKMKNIKMLLQQIEKESKPSIIGAINREYTPISRKSFIRLKIKLIRLGRKFNPNKCAKQNNTIDLTFSDDDTENGVANDALPPRYLNETEKQDNSIIIEEIEQKGKLFTSIEIGCKDNRNSRCKTDIYDLDRYGKILGCYNNTYRKVKMQYLNSATGLVFNYCCWYDRDKNVDKISNRLNSTTLRRIKIAHDCVPGQCNCCCKPILTTYAMFSAEGNQDLTIGSNVEKKKEQEDNPIEEPGPSNRPDRLVNFSESSIPSNNLLKKLITPVNLNIDLDNVILKTLLSNRNLQKPKLKTTKLAFQNEENKYNYYETDMMGEIIRSLTLDQVNFDDLSMHFGKPCCWYAREKMVNKLREEKQTEIVALMRRKHLCRIDKCRCCCQPTRSFKHIFKKIVFPKTPLYTKEYFPTPVPNKFLRFKGMPDLKPYQASTKPPEQVVDIEEEINSFFICGPKIDVSTLIDEPVNENSVTNESKNEKDCTEIDQTMPIIQKVVSLNPLAQTSGDLVKNLLKKFQNISLVVDKNKKVHLNFSEGTKDFTIEEIEKLNMILKYAQSEIDNMDETMRNYVISPVKGFYRNGTDNLMHRRESHLKSLKESLRMKTRPKLKKNNRKQILKTKEKTVATEIAQTKSLKRTVTNDKPRKKRKESIVTIEIDSDSDT